MPAAPPRLGPFELDSPLGSGGMATVWRAQHAASGVSAAIKFVQQARASDSAVLAGFQNEVRHVAALTHPHIVRVWDYGTVPAGFVAPPACEILPGDAWVALEFAGGGALDRSPPTDWETTRDLLLALLDALAHAHAHGVLHRDIKPANVLLPGPRDLRPGLKLTDFGLASSERGLAHPRLGRAGSPAYMAPEQVRGDWRSEGPWTDLYALGSMAWELCAGAPPFAAVNLRAVLRSQLDAPLPPLRARFAVPEELEAWLVWLLAKDPHVRCRFAADARASLLALGPPGSALDGSVSLSWTDAPLCLDDELPPEPTPAFSPPMAVPPSDWRVAADPPLPLHLVGLGRTLFALRRPPLVGREGPRDALWELLRLVRTTRAPHVARLRGPPGVGGGALARWLGARAHETGTAEVLRVRDAVGGADPWLGMLADHLRCEGLSGEALRDRLNAALPGDDAEIAFERDALARLLEGRSAGLAPSARQETLVRILGRIAGDRAVVVIREGATWQDDVAPLAAHLLDRPGRPVPVLLVTTERVEHDGAAEDATAVTVVTLGPLPPREMADILRRLLPLDPDLEATVIARAAGIPLFAVELVNDWVRRDAIVARDGAFRLLPSQPVGLPDDLYKWWWGRLRAAVAGPLDDACTALYAAAAPGSSVDVGEWSDVCVRLGAPLVPSLPGDLVRADLARFDGERFEFDHVLLREAIEHHARAAGRWGTVHRACAAALGGTAAPERRGRHLLEGDEPAQAIDPLRDAAELRLDRGEYGAAEALLSLADRALGAMDASPEHPGRVRAAIVRVRLAIARGAVGDAIALATRAAERARAAGLVRERYLALRYRGVACIKSGDPTGAEVVLDRAQDLAEAAGDGIEASRCLVYRATVARLRGDLQTARDLVGRALGWSLDAGDAIGAADARFERANVELGDGRFAEAEVQARLALDSYRALSAVYGAASAENTLGDILRRGGDAAAAETAYEGAFAAFERVGSPAAVFPLLNLGLLALTRGAFEEARNRLLAVRERAARSKNILAYVHLGLALSFVPDAPDHAVPHLDTAEEHLLDSGLVDRDLEDMARAIAQVATELDLPSLAAQARRIAEAQERARTGR